ncbi:MAG: sigma 54-interacting transcriptional regulator [Bacillota bacterium]|nr:sigma 54-interacting transcriptional regulator [Bacillota bacterium]
MKLSAIQKTTQAVADAISEAVGLETEIISDEEKIVAGTGRYKAKVGSIEKCGDSSTNEIYGMIFRTGVNYIIEDAPEHPDYWGVEGELAEVCCPIELDGKVIGIIGLVAFDEEQRRLLIEKKQSLLDFCTKMAYLLSSKAKEMAVTNGMKTILSSIDEGVLYVSRAGTVIECNEQAARLFNENYNEIVGNNIRNICSDRFVTDVVSMGTAFRNVERRFTNPDGRNLHFMMDIYPIKLIENEEGETDPDAECVGTVISMRDMADIKQMVYELTDNSMTDTYSEIIGESKAIRNIKGYINRIADSQSSVLITGESGTGKSLVAKAIHSSSGKKDKPFIHVNCAAIPDTLIESELFGYEAGAFTGARETGKPGKFEMADGGTIFLDEIGDVPIHLQGKLLHVLQFGKFERIGGTREISVDIRIIAATNRDLEVMIKNREFREDLFFRLNVIPMHMPSLRERREDLPLLLDNAVAKYSEMLGKPVQGINDETMLMLMSYNWPGNVRELENAIEFAINMEDSPVITTASLPESFKSGGAVYRNDLTLEEQCRAFERQIIERLLEEEGYSVNSKRKVAARLGIGEATLYRKIKSLGISSRGEQ